MHYMSGFLKHADAHPYMKEALGRHELYSEGAVYIDPGSLIVGNLDRVLLREPVIPRISANQVQQAVVEEILGTPGRIGVDKAEFSAKMDEMAPWILRNRLGEAYTEEETLAWESGTGTSCHYNGHQVLDYGRLLNVGLPGLIADLDARLARGWRDPDELAALQAYRLTLEGIANFIRRHAERADQLRAGMEPQYDDRQLAAISESCRGIVMGAPDSFLQGLQLHWFFMGFADYDSFGRFDQYHWPLYQKSIREGMTRDEAKSCLVDYWRKLDENGAILNMTIGGARRDGSDAVNDLTMLILEVTRELGLKGPNLCLRIRWDSPPPLWEAAHRGIARGQALPALYNEELIIPMLRQNGIDEADANDFCLAGCSQVVIPGKSSFACDMGTYNALKCLELALHDGFDPRIGKRAGPRTGELRDLDTFEKIMMAYDAQVQAAIRVGTLVNDMDHALRSDHLSAVRSLLTADCLDRGRGLFGGGARYYAVQNEVVGLTNVANSLEAIRQVAFVERLFTVVEIVAACDDNFQGREEMRQHLIRRVPKFGNDVESVDSLRVEVMRRLFSALAEHAGPLGGVHWPGEVIFHYNVTLGQAVGATPDGRLAGTPMADSCGASAGTDLKGPTALIKSAMKLPFVTDAYPNTCSCLNLKFEGGLWSRGLGQMVSLMRTYFRNGGYQLQINVLDQKELLAAKENPKAHESLVVRVGGYSAYFVHLDPAIQDDIIARTMHGAPDHPDDGLA